MVYLGLGFAVKLHRVCLKLVSGLPKGWPRICSVFAQLWPRVGPEIAQNVSMVVIIALVAVVIIGAAKLEANLKQT